MTSRSAPEQRSLMYSLVKAVLGHRAVALIAFLVLTALACFGLTRLRLAADPLTPMYPEGHPFRPALEAIGNLAPEPTMLITILERQGGDIYAPDTVAKIDRITKRLMSMEWVLPAGVTSLTKGFTDYEFKATGMTMEPVLGRTWPQTAKDFEALRRRVAVNPMGPGAYVSYDGTAAMISAPLAEVRKQAEQAYSQLSEAEKAKVAQDTFVGRKADAFFAGLRQFVAEVRSEEEDSRHRVYFMGPQLIEADMTAMGLRQIPLAASATFVLLLVLLAVHFRTLQGIVVPLAAMAASIVWGLGFFSLTGRQFNPMALMFPLVLGLFSVVLSGLPVGRYHRLLATALQKDEAVAAAYGNPVILASLVAAGLTVLGLGIAGVPLARDLGLLGLFWSVGAFAALFVLSPLLHSTLPSPAAARKAEPAGPSGPAPASPAGRTDLFGRLSRGPQRRAALVLLVVLLAVGGWAAPRLRVGDNTPGASYLCPHHPWNQAFDFFARKFMGPNQFLVYARATKPEGLLDPEVLTEFGDLCDFLKTRCGARECISLDMMVQLARRTLMDGNPKWQTVPASRDQVARLAGMVVEQGGVESFIDKTFTEATISPFFPPSDAGQIDRYASFIQDYLQAHPSDKVNYQLGGGLLAMTKAVNDATRDAYPRTLIAAFGIVLVLGTLVSRSLLLGLAATLALAAAQALAWALMLATGTPVSLPLVPSGVAAVGLGAAFAFPLLRRFVAGTGEVVSRAEAADDSSRGAAGETLFWGALVFCACLPWSFIGMKFQSQMVVAAGVIGLLEAVACVTFIPALVGALCPRRFPSAKQ